MGPFDIIIGYENEKRELKQISDIINNKGVYDDFGVETPRGLLIYGVPGVGKTLMAECLIEASSVDTFRCIKDKPTEEFIKSIKDTFAKAKELAPSIVFLDDLDKFSNNDHKYRDSEEFVAVQACVDSIKNSGVFVLATANNIEKLPQSLLRAGRLDRKMHIDTPKVKEAEGIIRHYISKKKKIGMINTALLARILSGKSIADLETVVNEAGIIAGQERAEYIEDRHMVQACLRIISHVVGTPEDYSQDVDFCEKNDLRTNTADQVLCHEVGHALVSEVLMPESVTLVAIHDEVSGIRGITSAFQITTNELEWIKSRITTALAGKAAVDVCFACEDIGASSDLETAAEQIQTMIMDNGDYGFMLYSWDVFTSEAKKQCIEQATAVLMEQHYRKARKIIIENKELFDKIYVELKRKGVLTTPEIQEIKENCGMKVAS